MLFETFARIGRRGFLQGGVALGALAGLHVSAEAISLNSGEEDRKYWLQLLDKVARPVLSAASERRLKELMPVEAPNGNRAERMLYTHLEALGRLLAGIAPWLESGSEDGLEGKLRHQYAEWARVAIQSATDPASPDYMNFCQGGQPLVDTAFLALTILRAPTELWRKLDSMTKRNVIAALESSRKIQPPFMNWLLCSATVEAALSFMGVWWDPMRVDYAIRTFDTWYKGDGFYGDGSSLHADYYNSFVIHPMLLNILETISKSSSAWNSYRSVMEERAQRYAAIQERLIASDGSFPPLGRSLSYRIGVFHLLAEISLRRQEPEGIAPGQVRSALTAVMHRMMEVPGTFDEGGWLRIGFCGHQPSIAEPYISTGSCYLCSAVWLPLGLPEADPFWKEPATSWTAKKIWDGQDVKIDHALG
ncbi:MAG: DUF2264 domain-containing protein [Terracidiphilus sp.]|jgi:hypothetical protein